MPARIPRPVLGVRRCTTMMFGGRLPALVLLRRLPVQQSALDIHSQLGHFFEALGSDEVLPVTLSLVFFNPLQILRGFYKDIADSKGIDRSQTVLVFALRFHFAPLIDDGKMLALSRLRSGRFV